MKNVFRIFIVVLLGASLYSCQTTKINDQPRAELSFNALPDTIQKLYLSFELKKDTTKDHNRRHIIINLWGKLDTVVCIDKDIHKVYHKNKQSWLPWVMAGTYWVFDDKELYFASTRGLEHSPYVLYERQLYFVTSDNVVPNKAGIMSSNYGKYDLSNVLK